MRRVEDGEVYSVFGAIEARYIAIDFHLGTLGSNCKSTWTIAVVPRGADGDVLRIAAAYYTYGSTLGGCLEVELYRRVFFDGKGDIAAHVRLATATATDVAARSSGYVGVIIVVLHFPILMGGVRLVCGKDGSVVRV